MNPELRTFLILHFSGAIFPARRAVDGKSRQAITKRLI
jgi:hypothetical protein